MSAPGVESLTVQAWALATVKHPDVAAALNLAPDAWAARVFTDPAPADAHYPLAVVGVSDPAITGGIGTTDWLALAGLTVRLVTDGRSYMPLIPGWKAAYALLVGNHETAVAATGGLVLTVKRDTSLMYPETAKGLEFRHLGASFSVYAQ